MTRGAASVIADALGLGAVPAFETRWQATSASAAAASRSFVVG